MSKPLDPVRDGAPGEPLLTVDGIETYYGNIQALKGISFKVAEGSIVDTIGKTLDLPVVGDIHRERGTVAKGEP